MITITTDIDIVSRGVMPVLHLSQYDSDFTLVFNIYASEGNFSMPSGTTAEIRGTKTDGNGYDAAGTVSGTTVTITGDEQLTAVAGNNIFEIALYYNSKRLNTINFVLAVERAALDADTITSESVLRELDAIVEGAEVATEAAAEAVAAAETATAAVNGKANSSSVAPEFSSSTAYSAGDYVMKEGQLYQARTDIAAGDWDSTKWVSSYMANKLKQMRNIDVESIHIATEQITGNDYGVFAYGYYSTPAVGNTVDISQPAPNSNCQCTVIEVAEGDHVKVNIQGYSSSYQAWAWLNSDREVVARSGLGNVVFKGEIVAPENAAYLIINTRQAYKGSYAYKVTDKPVTAIELAEDVDFTPISGKYWNTETNTAALTDYSSYAAVEILVSPGEIYDITIYNATSTKQSPIVFADNDHTVIDKINGSSGLTLTTRFEIPEGATRLLLSYSTNSISNFQKINRYIIDCPINLKGKKVAIIGDSISTNGNYDPSTNPYGNRPEVIITDADEGETLSAYVTYYDVHPDGGGSATTIGNHTFTDAEIGTEVTFTPVAADIGKKVGVAKNYNPAATVVWWEVMQQALGFDPIPVCWSGSSITSHEGDKDIYKASYSWHPSQIRKCGERIPGTMDRIAPDIIFVYRGTNDFSHKDTNNNYNILSDYLSTYRQTYPATDLADGYYDTVRGYLMLIKELRTAYPDAMIFLCTLNVFKRVVVSTFPTGNTVNSLPEYCNAIRSIADFMGCGIIEFDKDGITWENCYSSGYITDDAEKPTHPNNKGHMMMAIKALQDFIRQYSILHGDQV